MQTSVTLQDSYQFMILWVILALLFILVAIFLQAFFRIRNYRSKLDKPIKIKKPESETLAQIKERGLRELDQVYDDVVNQRITIRQGYLAMSCVIRTFVKDATGVSVDKYSLSEIEKIGMPNLTNLVREYYVPEFSRDTLYDIKLSYHKTRSVMLGWL